MRYGIYADIHGNFDAAQIVLEFLGKEKVDQLICIGDIVGYGAEPDKCIDLVKDTTEIVIAGNHDWACAGLLNIDYFTHYAKESLLWSIYKLSGYYKKYLSSLKLVYKIDDFFLVHGSLEKPAEFKYILNVYDAKKAFENLKTYLCFVGHTHIPMLIENVSGEISIIKIKNEYEEVYLESFKTYIINPGSVGQPRDGIPLTSFIIFDTEKSKVEFYRKRYPINNAQRKILNTGLPTILSVRLQAGH